MDCTLIFINGSLKVPWFITDVSLLEAIWQTRISEKQFPI